MGIFFYSVILCCVNVDMCHFVLQTSDIQTKWHGWVFCIIFDVGKVDSIMVNIVAI